MTRLYKRFSLSVECGTEQSQVEKFAEHFRDLRWTIGNEIESQCQVDIFINDVDGNWGCRVCPSGLNEIDVDAPESAYLMTELGILLYQRLRSAPYFRYGMVGIELDRFSTYNELIDDPTVASLPGIVVSEDIWQLLDAPSALRNFAMGYFWKPYEGEVYKPLVASSELKNKMLELLLMAEIEELIEKIKIDGSNSFHFIGKQLKILPDSLGDLLNLKELFVTFNQLTAIPESLGNLVNLVLMALYNNQLTKIPESLTRLTNLTYLDISNNQFVEIPLEIGNLNSLTCLQLSRNYLKTLPQSLGNLTNLTGLYIRFNQLETVPEIFSNLTKLIFLSIDNNQLTDIPKSLGNLTNLVQLDLYSNQLTRLPDSLGNLANLKKLDVHNNHLTFLPDSLGDLINLVELNLYNNQLTVLPESISNLINLTDLNINSNPLTDLSILLKLPKLTTVNFLGIRFPRRYWIKFSSWEPHWLLDETNVEIRRLLLQHVAVLASGVSKS